MARPKHIQVGTPEHGAWKQAEAERVAAYREKKQNGTTTMNQPKKTTLAIQQIVADEQIQPRLSLNADDVESYRQVIEAGGEMEPLVVFYDGNINWLSSGFTRRKAYELADITEVPVEIRQGTKRDAWLFAKGANKHGRRFSNEEKRRNVIEMLEDEECKDWTDRRIALHIGVSHEFVRQLRAEQVSTVDTSSTRTGRDGKQYPAKSSGKSDEKSTAQAEQEFEEPTGLKPNAGIGITWEFEGQWFYAEFIEHEFTHTKFGQETPTSRLRCRDLLTGQDLSPDYKKLQVRVMDSDDWANFHDLQAEAENAAELEEQWSNESAAETDGYGRPISPAPQSTQETEPALTPAERAAALPLYQAMKQYGHVGHLLLSAAAAWYQLEDARNKFAYAHSRAVPKHASGTFFDEATAFLRIPDPEKWEGCAACKGSMRIGDGDKCNSCKGGFTTHPGEGVSADVVSSHAASSNAAESV